MSTNNTQAVTDAMVEAYLRAQREACEHADRSFCGALHTNVVKSACRAGLEAALAQSRAQDAAPAGAGGEVGATTDWKHWCETCEGLRTIDETLGGEFFSNPKAECPDCDGKGYWIPRTTPQPQQADGRDALDAKDARLYRYIEKSKSGTIRLDGDGYNPDDFRAFAPQYIHWHHPDQPLSEAIRAAIISTEKATAGGGGV